MIRPTFNRIKSATTDESRLKFSSTGLPITSLTYLHKQTLCMYFINKLFVNVYDAPLLPQHHTSTYSASPVLIFRASRSAVASFSQLDADHKVTTWVHLPKSAQAAWEIRQQRTRYLYCAYLVCSQVVSAGAATAAGCRQGRVLGA